MPVQQGACLGIPACDCRQQIKIAAIPSGEVNVRPFECDDARSLAAPKGLS
jgi:hypothetical protein